MRRSKAISVRVRAPSRGLISRLPGEAADLLAAQGGLVQGTMQRAAARASNVRYEDGVVCNAPGHERITITSDLLDGLIAAWPLNEVGGDRYDQSGNNHTLTEITGIDETGVDLSYVLSETGKFKLAALFPALDNIGVVQDRLGLSAAPRSGTYATPVSDVADKFALSPSLAYGAVTEVTCPVVTVYPSTTWDDNQGGTSAVVCGAYDPSRRCLWIMVQAETYPDVNRIVKFSTATCEYVDHYWRGGSPAYPFGQNSIVYDPIHDRVILKGQAYQYVSFDPETGVLTPAGNSAFATLGGYRNLACDTTRGNILLSGVSGTENQRYEIGTIADATFSQLHLSDACGVALRTPVYSSGADKYVLLATNHNPALYYVDPVTYALTASTIDLASKNDSSSNLLMFPGTSVVAFVDSGSKLAFVNAATDTLLDRSNTIGDVNNSTYDSCSNLAVFYRTSDGIFSVDLSTFAMTEISDAIRGPVLAFDEWANLIYCVTHDKAPFSASTL